MVLQGQVPHFIEEQLTHLSHLHYTGDTITMMVKQRGTRSISNSLDTKIAATNYSILLIQKNRKVDNLLGLQIWDAANVIN